MFFIYRLNKILLDLLLLFNGRYIFFFNQDPVACFYNYDRLLFLKTAGHSFAMACIWPRFDMPNKLMKSMESLFCI